MSIFYMIVSIVLLRRMKASQAVNKRTRSLELVSNHIYTSYEYIENKIFELQYEEKPENFEISWSLLTFLI
jgi:hypothetical protein